MNKRVLKIRKTLGLNQTDFGKKLGVSAAAISKIESGDRAVTEQMTLAVCREFNVNEEWLRTGKGEMLNTQDDIFELMGFRAGSLTPRGEKLMRNILLMTNEELDELYEFAKKLVLEVEEEKKQAGEE